MRYDPKFTKEEIAENHKYFTERMALYKSLGQDFTGSREFILDKAGALKGSILEVGSGSGYMALTLAKAGYNFASIDNDMESLKKTALNLAYENLLPKVELRLMDGKSLSFKNGSFDNIFAINMFHHIDGVDDILSEMDRVLRQSGKIITSDFNRQGMDMIDAMHKKEGRVHTNFGVTEGHVYSYFSDLGYEINKHEDDYHWVIIAKKKNR
ncbi:MAG: class I SAM-dependent methyltransferase [Candidatus Omnitrophica bacterium]|nr:class I SAM-dependent methyltransferase [Candidatus Omnitrophota bacterium]